MAAGFEDRTSAHDAVEAATVLVDVLVAIDVTGDHFSFRRQRPMRTIYAHRSLQAVPCQMGTLEMVDDPMTIQAPSRPRLRGWFHLVATFAAVVALVVLVHNANSPQARLGAWIYGIASIALYATSGSYHVFAFGSRFRSFFQRLDHSMIYVLIAGTFTPVALVLLHGAPRTAALVVMWVGATVGVYAKLVWFERSHRLGGALYIVLGWAGLMALPALWSRPGTLALVVAGGVLYTVGAALFAMHRPRFEARWYGYHELWHTFGLAAGALLFAANLHLIQIG